MTLVDAAGAVLIAQATGMEAKEEPDAEALAW